MNVIFQISMIRVLQAVESPQIWNMLWKVLGFVNFYEKFWKSPGILHSICQRNFLFPVVYKEFLQSCYKTFHKLFPCLLTSFYIWYKMPKNNCIFQVRCLNMNGSSIGLGKNGTLLQYAVIALKISVLPIWKRQF